MQPANNLEGVVYSSELGDDTVHEASIGPTADIPIVHTQQAANRKQTASEDECQIYSACQTAVPSSTNAMAGQGGSSLPEEANSAAAQSMQLPWWLYYPPPPPPPPLPSFLWPPYFTGT